MELLGKISLLIHIVAGVSTLISGPIAIFYNFKDPKKHRMAGKLFFYAMMIVVVSSIIGFLKRPEVVFFQFLFGLSMLVLCGILRGVRSIFIMKGAPVSRFDWFYTVLLAFTGIAMIIMSARHFALGTMIALPILFGVFGFTTLLDVKLNYRVFSKPQLLDKIDWMKLHTQTMLGAFIASTTAFTVNAAHFLPWWAQWFGPTMLLLPLQFYFARKLQGMKRVSSRPSEELRAEVK